MSGLFDLGGKRALVTGGGSGIGLGMATGLAQHGAAVNLWGRTQSRLADAREQLSSIGPEVSTRVVDVSDEAAVVSGVDALVAAGGIDIAIVNAGVGGGRTPFLESTTEDYRRILATNLDGAYFTMREVCRAMVAGGRGGSIITVASIAAVDGAARNQAYGATKAAVSSLTRATAVEMGRHGIRVNAVLPGWIATDMTAASQASQKFKDNVLARVPIRRWGQPEDFAGIAVLLASGASGYQTGTTIVVDGGYTIF
jgi:NAD(P)-dependent dehydrogenase (short-subunit alcohol dehydrogenase family)